VPEHLEVSPTGRARCKLCKEPIGKAALRMGVSEPSPSFDGDTVVWHHAMCAALRRPIGMLRALATFTDGPTWMTPLLRAIAEAADAHGVKGVLWRHPTRARCVVELGAGRHGLFTHVGTTPLVVTGTLDEVLASVPDEDFEVVVDTVVAAGKQVGAAARPVEPVRKLRRRLR
jgi:hypothetical protein